MNYLRITLRKLICTESPGRENFDFYSFGLWMWDNLMQHSTVIKPQYSVSWKTPRTIAKPSRSLVSCTSSIFRRISLQYWNGKVLKHIPHVPEDLTKINNFLFNDCFRIKIWNLYKICIQQDRGMFKETRYRSESMEYLILSPTLAFPVGLDAVSVSHVFQLNCHKKGENVLIRIYGCMYRTNWRQT